MSRKKRKEANGASPTTIAFNSTASYPAGGVVQVDSEIFAAALAEIYVVVNPITYGDPEVRHETGEEVSDIPAESIPWLVEQGHIKLKGE